MLRNHDAIATVAVKDLERARTFYEGTLQLKLTPRQQPGALAFESGHGKLFVYPSQYAGTNQATAVTWVVGDDIERIVADLKAKGVVFEHYDLPDTTRSGDIHVAGSLKVAWLKDPDGNVLGLANGR
jgi:catechol 2,3-dioxygenase-like lactoylglutathione lyase family enzyme